MCIVHALYIYIICMNKLYISPVSWDSRTHRLHLCRGVRLLASK